MNAPDAIFAHTNGTEIPILTPRHQAEFADLPVRAWNTISRKKRFSGTWHFYLDDYKFDALWRHPERVAETSAINLVETNFTITEQTPYPVAMYRLYQKRWLSRYWQEKGFGIFVDLFVPPFYAEANLFGVPQGWAAYATKASDYYIDDLLERGEIAKNHSFGYYQLLVIGGGEKVAKACEKHHWIHVRDVRKR